MKLPLVYSINYTEYISVENRSVHETLLQIWQTFVGARARRVERYYQNLLAPESDTSDSLEQDKSGDGSKGLNGERVGVPEKWRRQIEKVIDAWALHFIIQSFLNL